MPAAILYLILSPHPSGEEFTDAAVISVLILLTPFILFHELQRRRIHRIEAGIPEFLKRLAVINDVGMPIVDSIRALDEANLGLLSAEVKLMSKDLGWSHDLRYALTKFESRVRTVALSRIIRLITRASETTGNIKETLRVAANYAELAEKLRQEKFNIMFSYLIVVYMAFAVFLIVLYVFITMFLPHVPDTTVGVSAGGFSISSVREYPLLFFHAAIIQGFVSGIIAGQMMGVNIYDGMKHSMIMVTSAYLLFQFI